MSSLARIRDCIFHLPGNSYPGLKTRSKFLGIGDVEQLGRSGCLEWDLQKGRFFRETKQVVLRKEFEKLIQRQVVLGTVERQHEELLPLAVIDVDGPGRRVLGGALQD